LRFAGNMLQLVCNATLGFTEELKAAAALVRSYVLFVAHCVLLCFPDHDDFQAELTNKMEKKIPCLRDGKAEPLLTRLLVPGDVVLMMGGAEVPADIEWLEGDKLSIDTAALTGEPLPRKYPSDQYGKLILCGCTVNDGEAYGIVRKTGTNTEIGSAQADIMHDKATVKVSVFEQRVLLAVKVIVAIALADVIAILLVQGLGRPQQFYRGTPMIKHDLLTCLSIIVAAVPIALPLVVQVTMALGAAKMATKYNSVVTSLPALQDISSMTVLCSDKTGTLTTAKITIHAESVWCCGDFSREDVALFAGLASNRDKKEDAIDRSVVNHFDKMFGKERAKSLAKEYKKERSVGFNPEYKRVLFEYSHRKLGKVTVVKGLPSKILNTEDGGRDDAEDQWKCDDYEQLEGTIKQIDEDFSKNGYKTLGVAVKKGNGPFKFVGILPMLDPPRHDTAQTIKYLVNAGIELKMITGDHQNIAMETARLIELGTNIRRGEAIREDTPERDELVKEANGFAQVLPKDKREVVMVLRDKFKFVVGMTGDGVNDAPALSAAQCGIAVDDATDAAKNAAAIILTSPGLSAIYAAVVESRRIFRKLKSYVTYRFAATTQIVLVLSLLIYVSNCPINSLFVVLLALFNDLTMLPIAYDLQEASKNPENPNVARMLSISLALGFLETGFSLMFAYGVGPSAFGSGNYTMVPNCPLQLQSAIWLQMFMATEFLIFSTRAPSLIWWSLRPSVWLVFSVTVGCVVASVLAGQSSKFGSLPTVDIVLIWCYDLVVLVVVDICKVALFSYLGESNEVLEEKEYKEANHKHAADASYEAAEKAGTSMSEEDRIRMEEDTSRHSMSANRLTDWTISQGSRLSFQSQEGRPSAGRKSSVAMDRQLNRRNMGRTTTVTLNIHATRHDSSHLRPSIITAGSLRPNTPAANLRGIKLRQKQSHAQAQATDDNA
jgi:H+-transporting ATPase